MWGIGELVGVGLWDCGSKKFWVVLCLGMMDG